MGIPGITKFINMRSREFYEFQLHDTNLVIDGSSLCFSLYNWNYSYWKSGYSYDCYGADYDKYAEIVKCFFQMLNACNVKCFIVFGGTNGQDRISKIISRTQDHIKIVSTITPESVRNNAVSGNRNNFGSHPVSAAGAFCLKTAFRDVISELKLPIYNCENDPNREISSFAKALSCPILSNNSEFYFLGSTFIPFSSIQCDVQDSRRMSERRPYKYIKCKIYEIRKLLTYLDKQPFQQPIIYLVPVLLGCDQINQDIFESFFKTLRLSMRRQDKIDGILKWIRSRKSFDDALKLILATIKDEIDRKCISKQINYVIEQFSSVPIDSLMEYFNIEGSRNLGCSNESHKSDIVKSGGEKLMASCKETLLKRVKENLYPSIFLDMYDKDRYLLSFGIEDVSQPDANTIAYPIMAAIHNVIVESDDRRLTVLRRTADTEIEEYVLSSPSYPMPSIEEIDYLRLESRQQIMLKVLEIDESIIHEIFNNTSEEWQMFILTLNYVVLQTTFDNSLVFALILCFIILNYVDPNLSEFCRSSEKEIKSKKILKSSHSKVSLDDSKIFMQKCIKYFEIDPEETSETYDRDILHNITQYQCVFLQIKFLNILFNFPVQNSRVHKMFDNTFIYNMTKYLRDHNALNDHLEQFLDDTPTVKSVFFEIVDLLTEQNIISR